MNLHAIAFANTRAVNPQQTLIVQVSTGNATNADGTRTPTYAAPVTVLGDVQALTYKDIQQISGLNLNGTRRAIYLNGEVDGLVRVENKGGDLITDQYGNVWLVALVLEQWSDVGPVPSWVKCAVTLQNGS